MEAVTDTLIAALFFVVIPLAAVWGLAKLVERYKAARAATGPQRAAQAARRAHAADRARAERRVKRARRRDEAARSAWLGMTTFVKGDLLVVDGGKYSVAGAHASVQHGAPQSRMTATRVVTGGVLFGPVGAIVGGMAKKDQSKVYLTVLLADGNMASAAFPLSDERQVLKFAQAVNRAGRHYAEVEHDAAA